MNEYTNFLKVGTMAILLRMLEDPNVVMRDMTLENPIRAIREISHDITCTRTVRLANGRELSALQIQQEYLDRALVYADRTGLPRTGAAGARHVGPRDEGSLHRSAEPVA